MNLEWIRPNFQKEIADGRVILVPEGAGDETGSMDFDNGVGNSLIGTLVRIQPGAHKIKVPVRPLDDMLRMAGIDRVDFLKMDIEDAKRQALRGAAGVVGKCKARLMLDSYHVPDDAVVLPKVIAAGNPAYRSFCAACSFADDGKSARIITYAVFYE